MQDRKRETADALQNVGGDSSRKRRAITHMQGQKIERKARFYGLVWNINKPTIDELSSEGIT